MVNITQVNTARLSPVLNTRAWDIIGRKGFGRKAIQDKDVPYLERTPLALKNIVSLQGSKAKNQACMNEMMEVIACLGKYDQNQSMCSKEIGSFNSCFSDFKAKRAKEKAFEESGEMPKGPRAKLTGHQMNSYMKQFTLSSRKGEFNNPNVYKDHYKFK